MTPLSTRIAWSDQDSITIRGLDLCDDIIGHFSLTDLLFLELKGRRPTESERRMLDALLVAVAEHGITPSVIAARMTLLGSPEALQGAVAAGLLGAGSVYLGTTEQAAEMLYRALSGANEEDPAAVAERIVAERRAQRKIIPGIGHPIHVHGDPRTLRLFKLATEWGFYGRHCALLVQVGERASEALGRPMPVNAAGAVGAIAADMGFDSRVVRGLGVAARSVGLLGHLLEEMDTPMASHLWKLAEDNLEH